MCACLKSCCCCISLEVGTQLISVICTVSSAAIALSYGWAGAVVRRDDARVKFYGFVTLAAAAHTILSCLLAYAAFAHKPRLMRPWLLLTWVLAAMLTLLSVLGAAALIYTGVAEQGSEVYTMITLYFIYSAILWLLSSVVNSRRAELAREQDGKRLMRPSPTAWKYV